MRFLFFYGLVGILVGFLIQPLMAISPEIDSLIQENRHAEAIVLLETLANEGDKTAQNKLGEVYHLGPSDIRDYSNAMKWYLKAVAQGCGVAANHLGRLYLNGEGVSSDPGKAKGWYKKGMELGDIHAERNYYYSEKNAFYYILDRALENDAEACFIAARFYEEGGVGIQKNTQKANEFYQKASQLGYNAAH